MDRNSNGKHQISDSEREAFKKALTIHYSGKGRIVDAFAEVEAGLIDRYYRRKKKHPHETAAIEAEARADAEEKLSAEMQAFQAEQFTWSVEIQRKAVKALENALAHLGRIASGQPYQVRDEATGELKMVKVYPRDSIQAARFILDLARNGVLPRGFMLRSLVAEKPEPEYRPPLAVVLGVRTDFSSVSAVTPDGRRVTVTRDQERDIIESEDE